jgi:HEAT repeat protein
MQFVFGFPRGACVVLGSMLVAPSFAQIPLPDRLEGPLAILLPDDGLLARAVALRALARGGTLEGAAQVVEALADPSPLLADAAVLACGELVQKEGAALLLGPGGLGHPRPEVRMRAATALARTRVPLDSALLGVHLPRKDGVECRLVLGAIEQLVRNGQLRGDLDEAARTIQVWLRGKNSDETRAAALATLGAMSRERAERYAATLLRERPRALIFGAAVECAMRDGLVAPHVELEKQLRSADAAVRSNALRLASWRGDREGLLWLVDALAREERAGLRWRCVELLERNTGQRLGLDATAWRTYVNALPLDWSANSVSLGFDPSAPRAVDLEQLGALQVRSDRFALVVHLAQRADANGVSGAPVPRQRARPRLVSEPALLAALDQFLAEVPQGVRLDVVRADADVTRANGHIEVHRVESLPTLSEFIRSSARVPSGDVHGALQTALMEPQVDRVFFVTRGGAPVGPRVDWGLIVDEALSTLRFRGIVVDVVLIDPTPELLEPLKRLANGSGGRMFTLRG